MDIYLQHINIAQGNGVSPCVSNRFILDIRCGCAAVRDTKHPKYNKDYPGLHRDTCDGIS